MEPGVFKVECIPIKRAYFGYGPEILLDMREFMDYLSEGICSSEELLNDYQKYRPTNFHNTILISGPEFLD